MSANETILKRCGYHPRRASSLRRGVALVWVAILAMVLIGMLGMAIDAGVVALARQQLQNAADAAALAGAVLAGPRRRLQASKTWLRLAASEEG